MAITILQSIFTEEFAEADPAAKDPCRLWFGSALGSTILPENLPLTRASLGSLYASRKIEEGKIVTQVLKAKKGFIPDYSTQELPESVKVDMN